MTRSQLRQIVTRFGVIQQVHYERFLSLGLFLRSDSSSDVGLRCFYSTQQVVIFALQWRILEKIWLPAFNGFVFPSPFFWVCSLFWIETLAAKLRINSFQAVIYMFQSQGVKCVPYLPDIIPTYLSTIKTCDPSIKEVRSWFFYDFWVVVMTQYSSFWCDRFRLKYFYVVVGTKIIIKRLVWYIKIRKWWKASKNSKTFFWKYVVELWENDNLIVFVFFCFFCLVHADQLGAHRFYGQTTHSHIHGQYLWNDEGNVLKILQVKRNPFL